MSKCKACGGYPIMETTEESKKHHDRMANVTSTITKLDSPSDTIAARYRELRSVEYFIKRFESMTDSYPKGKVVSSTGLVRLTGEIKLTPEEWEGYHYILMNSKLRVLSVTVDFKESNYATPRQRSIEILKFIKKGVK